MKKYFIYIYICALFDLKTTLKLFEDMECHSFLYLMIKIIIDNWLHRKQKLIMFLYCRK